MCVYSKTAWFVSVSAMLLFLTACPPEGEDDDSDTSDAATDTGVDTGDPAEACEFGACGPALGMPNTTCDDGTIAGPTGRCLNNVSGVCAWEVATCDDDADTETCGVDACGPPLGMPNWLCDDGTLAGPTGQCLSNSDGTCGWEIADCGDDPDDPGSCRAEACGPGLGMPNWICDDGTLGGPRCSLGDDGTCGWVIETCEEHREGGDGCDPSACDHAPAAPTILCADGTVAGPVCELTDPTACGWVFSECPDDAADSCEVVECGPAPGAPNFLCDDGSVGGPTCDFDAEGSCAWQFRDCPSADDCPADECGPAPGMPNWTCDDGTLGGPFCQPNDDGLCHWVITECDPTTGGACGSGDCGPQMGVPNWLCDDGTIGGPLCAAADDGTCSWQIVECP